MIRSPLRAGIALACALSLSACGGVDGDVFISGTVQGNTKDGLVITNNDGPRLAIAANQTSFTFPELVETDAGYNVKVVESPDNTQPTTEGGKDGCKVVNGTGTGKAVFAITTVRIVCTPKVYALTVRLNGARSGDLELVNGADRKLVKPGESSVEMTRIAENAAYGVTVLTPPPGQTCTVANGSGKMSTSGATVDVNCTTP